MSSTNFVLHVRRTCGYLMSRQLLRPEGVKGLCAAVFGDHEDVDNIQLDKLQHISRVLTTAPATKPEVCSPSLHIQGTCSFGFTRNTFPL